MVGWVVEWLWGGGVVLVGDSVCVLVGVLFDMLFGIVYGAFCVF